MQIKLIVAGAAIALIAGVGSVSANEFSVADTTVAPDTPFAMLDGIAASQMSVHELAATRGGSDIDIPFTVQATSMNTSGTRADVFIFTFNGSASR